MLPDIIRNLKVQPFPDHPSTVNICRKVYCSKPVDVESICPTIWLIINLNVSHFRLPHVHITHNLYCCSISTVVYNNDSQGRSILYSTKRKKMNNHNSSTPLRNRLLTYMNNYTFISCQPFD